MSTAFFLIFVVITLGALLIRMFVAEGHTEEEVIDLTKSLRMYTKEADQYLNVVGQIYRRGFSLSVVFLIFLFLFSCEMKNSC